MPEPSTNEDEKTFVTRCMGDGEALSDFPRADQRNAFCQSQWRRHKAAGKVVASLKERGVGKVMGKKVYAHQSALTESDARAVAVLEPEGVEWNVVKLHEDTGAMTFVWSPDWDTADEPTVGDSVLVKPDGTETLRASGDDPMIYHHKWQFVEEDYSGFDVHDSRARSSEWESLPGVDRSRIGKRSFWETNVVPRLQEARLREAVEVLTDADRELVSQAMGHRTAIARSQPSKPLRFYKEKGLLTGDVLDYGGGRDVHDYARWDPHFAPDPAPLSARYDTVMCNYVLNVTPVESLRSQVMSAIRGLLKEGGKALVSCWQKQTEDVKTGTSFQAGWDADRWETFFEANGWSVEPLKMPGGMAWALQPAAMQEALKEAVTTFDSQPAIAEWVAGEANKEALAFYESGHLRGAVLDYGGPFGEHDHPTFDPDDPDLEAVKCGGWDTVLLHGLGAMAAMSGIVQALLSARALVAVDGQVLVWLPKKKLSEGEGSNGGWDNYYTYPTYPTSGWSGKEWWEFFRDTEFAAEPLGETEHGSVYKLEPSNGTVGLSPHDEQPVYGSTEGNVLAEAHALRKRLPR